MRLVAVLGYSGPRTEGLDPICAARLRRAEELAADAVVFSGRARRRTAKAEADLMHAAWRGAEIDLVVETTARNTAENAAGVAAVARRLGADEVVVVTSRWHLPRALLLVRTALRGSAIGVRGAAARDRPPLTLLAREVACVVVLPYHLRRAARG